MENSRTPQRHALLVGVDLYLNDGSRKHDNGQRVSINGLRGCCNDVNAVKTFLQNRYGLDHISILSSTAPESSNALTNMKPVESADDLPTFDNIKREFDAVYSRASPGDFFYFHFSGHGARLKRVQASPLRADMNDPSLLTVDFGYGKPAVRGWQLNSWLKQLTEKGIQTVVALDSCYSGGSWRDDCRVRTQGDLATCPNLPIDEYVAKGYPYYPSVRDSTLETSWSINPDGITIMTACDIEEKAAEITVNGKPHGAFTYKLLDFLKGARPDKDLINYRTIRDHLAHQIKGQTPRVYGRDRLLFFGKTEPFAATPLIVRIESDRYEEGGTVIVPAGRVHGVHRLSEFAPSPLAPETSFCIEEVDDFESRSKVSSQLVETLQKTRCKVFPSRWSFGQETFQVLLGSGFGPEFQASLEESIQSRVASRVEVIRHDDSDGLNANLLRLGRSRECIEIFGPEDLIGYTGPVRGLQRNGGNTGQEVPEAAIALTHIARFRQILELRGEASDEAPPFKITLSPIGLTPGADRSPDGQRFSLAFYNESEDDLYFTVLDLGPGFHIKQLSPQHDSAWKVHRHPIRVRFNMTIPDNLKDVRAGYEDIAHRDIIRILVTKDKELSWKSLEMPDIWDAGQVDWKKETSPGRHASLVSSFEWWIHDETILTIPA